MTALAWAIEQTIPVAPDRKRSRGTDKVVLIVLAHKADHRGRAGIRRDEIMELSGLRLSTIARALRQLTAMGFIRPEFHGVRHMAYWLELPSLKPGFDIRTAQQASNGHISQL